MSERRRRVFVEKVLKRLFPNVLSSQGKGIPQTLISETPPLKTVNSGKVKCKPAHHLTGAGDVKAQPEHRLYTVSLPPEGYIPMVPEPSHSADSEIALHGADAEAKKLGQEKDQGPHDRPKKRIRRHKSKKFFENFNNVQGEQEELEKQLQEKLQPERTDGPTISKNKKRKLKKKQQIKRKKAAGSVAKASSVSFTYQPGDSSSEQEDVEEAVGEGSPSTPLTIHEVEELISEEDGPATTQEDSEIPKGMVDGILSFLKSTQEIYFYDGVSNDSDSAVRVEAARELVSCLASHSMPASDVLLLDHMKALLLLQNTEGLQRALEMFPEHCRMPSDHARVISAFFNYWITHILPKKNNE